MCILFADYEKIFLFIDYQFHGEGLVPLSYMCRRPLLGVPDTAFVAFFLLPSQAALTVLESRHIHFPSLRYFHYCCCPHVTTYTCYSQSPYAVFTSSCSATTVEREEMMECRILEMITPTIWWTEEDRFTTGLAILALLQCYSDATVSVVHFTTDDTGTP